MYLGIDVGGTNLKAGVIAETGEIVYQLSKPSNAHLGFGHLAGNLINMAESLINRYPSVQSLGVGIPGVLSSDGVIIVAPNLPEAVDFPLIKYLKSKFALPLAADNDANAAALAELEFGAGAGLKNFLYVTLGTGVGGAIISNGGIFRGESGAAGEIGHTFIDYRKYIDNLLNFQSGTLESHASRQAIIDRAKQNAANFHQSNLNQLDEIDVKDISQACENGDEAARECLTNTGKILGIGLASAMNLLDLGLVIVGGGISSAHPVLFDTALDTIRKCALAHIAAKADIRKAKFGGDAGIIGAAMVGKGVIDN